MLKIVNKIVYDFSNYKAYFRYKLEEEVGSWGVKAKLSKAMNCQPAYLSQVMKDKAELSLEQVYKAIQFFGLLEDEKNYLILLHQRDRAGDSDLKKYFKLKLDEALEKRLSLVQRQGGTNALTESERGTYYSSWIYTAIHFAVGIPAYQSRENLRNLFKIKNEKFNAAIEFLLKTQLIRENQGQYQIGVNSIRLGNDSRWIIKHHTNWRIKAIENFENEDLLDFHYSGVYTLSEEDVKRIKSLLLDSIKTNIAIVGASKEEKMYVFNLDFFDLLKTQ